MRRIKGKEKREPHIIELKTDKRCKITLIWFFSGFVSIVQFTFPGHLSGYSSRGWGVGQGGEKATISETSFTINSHFPILAECSELLSFLFLLTTQLPNLCHALQMGSSNRHRWHFTNNFPEKTNTPSASWSSTILPPSAPVFTVFSPGPESVAPCQTPKHHHHPCLDSLTHLLRTLLLLLSPW